MAAYRVTDAQLTALANAIRSKSGTNDALQFPGGFLQAIRAISGGGAGGGLDTSDADAAAEDIRSGLPMSTAKSSRGRSYPENTSC